MEVSHLCCMHAYTSHGIIDGYNFDELLVNHQIRLNFLRQKIML